MGRGLGVSQYSSFHVYCALTIPSRHSDRESVWEFDTFRNQWENQQAPSINDPGLLNASEVNQLPRSLRSLFDDPSALPPNPMQMGAFGRAPSPYDTSFAAASIPPPWATSITPSGEAQGPLGVPDFSMDVGDTIRKPPAQITIPSDGSESHASSGHDDETLTESPEEEHGGFVPSSPTVKFPPLSTVSPITAQRSPSRQDSDSATPTTPHRRFPPRGASPAPSPISVNNGYVFPALDPPSAVPVPPLPASATSGHQRLPALYPGASPLSSRQAAAGTNMAQPFTRSLGSLAAPSETSSLSSPSPSSTSTSTPHLSTASQSSAALRRPSIGRQASMTSLESASSTSHVALRSAAGSSLGGIPPSPSLSNSSPRQLPARAQTQAMTTLAPTQLSAQARGYRSEPEDGMSRGARVDSPNTPSTIRPVRRQPSPSGRAPLRVSLPTPRKWLGRSPKH